jgi:hypothetical protein
MSLVVDISLNGNPRIARYAIRRLTNTDSTKPSGTVNRYAITKVVEGAHEEWEFVGYVNHAYDDKPERLVELAMQKILEVK